MDSESSYIVLSIWGSPLSPTKTRNTLDQQPAPANTNLIYHQNTKRNQKFLQQSVVFSKMRNARRKKTNTWGKIGEKGETSGKNNRPNELEDGRGQNGTAKTFFDVGSRVGLDNPSTPPVSLIQLCSAIVGSTLINSPFIKKKQEELKRIALLNMGTHAALRLVMV